MEEDHDPISVPVLEPHEADAIFAVVVRMVRCDVGNTADREKIAELQAAIDARSEGRPKLMAAIDAFGFEVDKPDLWVRVREALGPRRFLEAYHVAYPERYPFPPSTSAVGMSKPDTGFDQQDSEAVDDNRRSAGGPAPKISDAILQYLRSIYRRGAQVAEVKRHLLDVYGLETHEKTPGMTLYRMSREGLVRREGRTWYATEMTNTTDIGTAALRLEAKRSSEDREDDEPFF